MGVIDKSETGKWPFDKDEYLKGKCHLCDNEAVAFFDGRNPLLICEECAVRLLPVVIVDALSDENKMGVVVESFVRAIQARNAGCSGHNRKGSKHIVPCLSDNPYQNSHE
jgi:hypothetical protein